MFTAGSGSSSSTQQQDKTFQMLLDEIAKQSAKLHDAPYRAYGGQRLAPIPRDILAAHELGKRVGQHEPYTARAEQMLAPASRGFPQEHQRYMNPYMQDVVNRIAVEGNRNFTENIMPALEAKFIRLGQHGGSRHADLARRAARDVQDEILAKQQQALAGGYQQAAQIYNADMARQLEAAKQTANFGGLNQAGKLADMAALIEQGKYQQMQEQAARDIGYADFLRQQEEPQRRLAQHAATVRGIPVPLENVTMVQTPGTPAMNTVGQIGQLAGGIYSMLHQKRGGHIRKPKKRKVYRNTF